MSGTTADLPQRKGDYGFDAPYVPIMMSATVYPAVGGVWLLVNTASYLYTTRAWKFSVWAGLLDSRHSVHA